MQSQSNRALGGSCVRARLPHAGLGNMLLVWARALAFARMNQLPLFTSSWAKPHIGPILRGETRSRWYAGNFVDHQEVPVWYRPLARTLLRRFEEPVVAPLALSDRTLYEFTRVPHWENYFGDFSAHRDLVRAELWRILHPRIRKLCDERRPPCIAVHVRQGDFRVLNTGENFAKVGQTRTPLDYFSEIIDGIRAIAGSDLPVTVFTDGRPADLTRLLSKPATEIAPVGPDIVDMMIMARSHVIVCSAGSTFSYWAGFLADAPLLLHPDHIYAPIRPPIVNECFFEGGVRGAPDAWPELLTRNIRAIGSQRTVRICRTQERMDAL